VVLLDVQMPTLDGLETARRLAGWPAERRPHIVALTASALPGDRERCLAAGMAGYLSKPVALEALDAELRQARGRLRPGVPARLDPQIVEQLRELAERSAPGLLDELIELFYRANGERLELLREALRRQDRAAIPRLLHAMKGSCGQMGAVAVVELLTAAEEAAGPLDPAWAPEVEQRLSEARVALRAAVLGPEEPPDHRVIPLRKAR
jgi:CheY-like chemotaxis protein